ncbi:MAG: T9SS type A sorting domain-containing protein [Flavobacteriales bacterium]|nr:T9SS type A sorting domain-containing protein [Flavobacteriales bacterium]
MKTFLLVVLTLFITLTSISQLEVKLGNAPVYIKHGSQPNAQPKENTIWSEDFANGIPADWTNTESGGVAYWEYRGPDTDPDIDTGARGSCFPDGLTGEPVESVTWANGFVIFDSNWWDDPNGPCGNLGSGPAPAPHVAVLESPSFDLSVFPRIGISFTQHIKNNLAEQSVEISLNDGPWQEVFQNNIIINQETEDAQIIRINITDEAAGQADVRFRFVFTGTYYYWMLDDIQLLELDENNLHFNSTTYGDFDFYAPEHPTGFEDMEYGQYPNELAPVLRFSCMAENYGAEVQTEVGLNIKVVQDAGGNVIHNGTSTETFNLQPGGEAELRAGEFQMPGTQGWYSIPYQTFQNEEENTPADNRDTLHFAITDATYARDKGPVAGVFVPAEEFSDTQYEIGNVYLITNNGINAHSVSAAVTIGSSVGSEIYAAIYEFGVETTINATLLATTEHILLTAEMLNDIGEANLVHLYFDSPVALEDGHAYLVVAGSDAGPSAALFGSNGKAEDFTSWIRFFPTDWFYLLETAIVRLNIGPVVGVEEFQISDFGFQIWPNPVADQLHISFDVPVNDMSSIAILDVTGRVVMKDERVNMNTNSFSIDVSNLPAGCYQLKAGTLQPQKFVVQH